MTTIANTDLAFAGPTALAAQVRAGEVSPRELVELYLRRIEEINPRLNAFRTLMAEQALAEADERIGHDGPLAGVPIAIKDDVAVTGQVATRGSRSFGPPAVADAEIVRRLRAAGAIPIGITTTPELFIFPWTATEANGVTRNPWNTDRTTGGSSGGSAAAVAAGLVAAATASDGGGSIRIPAAANGLVGMKPSRGRVSSAPSAPGWLGLSVLGSLTRTVADSALMLDVMHGVGPDEPEPAPPFSGRYVDAAAAEPGRLRIAVSRKPPTGMIAPVAADQRGAWERTADLLSELGHDVEDRDPDYGLVQLDFLQMWLRGVYEEAASVPDPSLARALHAADGRRRALSGSAPPAPGACSSAGPRSRRESSSCGTTSMSCSPRAPRRPRSPPRGVSDARHRWPSTSPAASPRSPRCSISPVSPRSRFPPASSIDGLPLSVQLVGRPGAEDVLYSLAGQIEQAVPWAQRRPALAG